MLSVLPGDAPTTPYAPPITGKNDVRTLAVVKAFDAASTIA